VFIIRHGTTAYNVGEKRVRGRIDLSLSKEGFEEAEKIGKVLSSTKIDVIYYSPIKRAKQTAEAIKKYQPNADFVEEPLLIDLSFGDWEGKTYSEIFKTKEAQERFRKQPSSFIIPNGETFYQGLDRIHRLFSRLKKQKEDTVALVTHGAIINLILIYLYKTNIDLFWRLSVEPGSISEIELQEDWYKIIKVNDTHHLKD